MSGVPGDRGTGLLGGRRCQAIDVAGWLRSGAGQSSVYIVGRSMVLGDRGRRVARVIEGTGRSRVLAVEHAAQSSCRTACVLACRSRLLGTRRQD